MSVNRYPVSKRRYNEKIADISGEIADISGEIADIFRRLPDGVYREGVAVEQLLFIMVTGSAKQHKKAGRISSSLRVTFNLATAIFFIVL
ncbi:hypothetical protein [Bacillus sp. SH7-1]|uniref:hypothetical protein n=1 Tax=Bacillus sp. SH7-1 TaxID=2217818 RepID=UPI0015D39C11|nr:hypothetical protein [Bacillus sp. SH7-1]